ncbi:hypothetical protein HL653_20450 [Sphingomonas sp. AP4-R1]|uniref:hypothetical protein n=1 Tax=Sphingomonas sp. AP4-R1 TaxID=2735134 RepID=UPI0014933B0E|nr:hypothetical protein [Sphingomonas sp. AP4-R1]QJU59804.1 hypothetical protein HL653_20450 [Sphingomonas sp. AP4-R1]
MGSADRDDSASGRVRAALLAIISILILMWPALINGQPFFFSDTSSYVRAGDIVGRMVGGRDIATVWTIPDASPPPASAHPSTNAVPTTAPEPKVARGNDPASGYIMAGRSPYFGLLLWLAWVTSHFWLFVVLQAAIAYYLIGATLRCFGVDRPDVKLAVVGALAVASPLAIYNGLLLADALSGFGIAAFLILLAPGIRLARWEIVLLALILIASTMSHLTHVVMLAGMLAVIGLLVLSRQLKWRHVARAVVIGSAALAIGAGSVVATGAVVKAHFGKSPVLVPLITARFIADGPGRDFIEAGCEGRRFAVCRIPYRGWTNSTIFLWSRDPATGAFLIADTDTRLAMSREDKAFALAVAKAYPVRAAWLAIWNSLLQITDLRIDIVDEGCFAQTACIGGQFPASIIQAIAATPGGRSAWPREMMNMIVYAGAALSLVALAILLPRIRASAPGAAKLIGLWLLLVATAMAINGFLGGAISEPQSRYQTRMAWLLPLLALIAWFVARAQQARRAEGLEDL